MPGVESTQQLEQQWTGARMPWRHPPLVKVIQEGSLLGKQSCVLVSAIAAADTPCMVCLLSCSDATTWHPSTSTQDRGQQFDQLTQ